MNNNENTLAVPNTVIEELRGAELIAWIMAEKFFIFSHRSDERNYLPLSTTIEKWYEAFNFTQRGHKEITEAFKSLEEKGFIYNNEIRCHTKDGEWTNFEGNEQFFFGTENSGYTAGIKSLGGFTPINNEVTFSSKLSVKDKAVLTALLYRWRFAETHKTYLCVFKEIENTFGLIKVNDVMEKLKKKNIVDYKCNRGGWRELINFEINISALDIKTRSTETKRHYNKSGKPRKPYTRKTNTSVEVVNKEIEEDIFMNYTLEEILEAMEQQDAETAAFEKTFEPEPKVVENVKEDCLTKYQASMITGCRGMCPELKNRLLQELINLPVCYRDSANVYTLYKRAYNNLTEEQKEMGKCYFNHEKYTGTISTKTARPEVEKESKEMPSLFDMFNEAETTQDDYEEVKEKYVDYINDNKEFVVFNDGSNKDYSFDNNEDPESIKPGFYTKGTAKAVIKVENNEPENLTEEDFYFVDEPEEKPAVFDFGSRWQDNEKAMDNFSAAYGF